MGISIGRDSVDGFTCIYAMTTQLSFHVQSCIAIQY